MDNCKEIVDKFIVDRRIIDDDNTMGILSYQNKNNSLNDSPDKINLFIVTETGPSYQGGVVVYDKLIEYLIQPSFLVTSRMSSEIHYQDHTLATYFITGNRLYDPKNHLQVLKDQATRIIQRVLPKSFLTIDNQRKILNQVFYTKDLINKDSYLSDYAYYCTLNMLREKYHSINGKSLLEVDEVIPVYGNKELCDQHYITIPNQIFSSHYIEAVQNDISKESKLFYLDYFLKELSIPLSLEFLPTFVKREMEVSIPNEFKHQEYIRLSSQILKTEMSIESNNDNYEYLYYLTIEQLLRLSKDNSWGNEKTILFANAVKSTNNVERINSLNSLFNYTFKEIDINTTNYQFLIK